MSSTLRLQHLTVGTSHCTDLYSISPLHLLHVKSALLYCHSISHTNQTHCFTTDDESNSALRPPTWPLMTLLCTHSLGRFNRLWLCVRSAISSNGRAGSMYRRPVSDNGAVSCSAFSSDCYTQLYVCVCVCVCVCLNLNLPSATF